MYGNSKIKSVNCVEGFVSVGFVYESSMIKTNGYESQVHYMRHAEGRKYTRFLVMRAIIVLGAGLF